MKIKFKKLKANKNNKLSNNFKQNQTNFTLLKMDY